MLKFKKLNASIDTVPSVGFVFKDPDTGMMFKSTSYKCFDDLEEHVQKYREQNDLPPIDNFREVWEHYICSNFPNEQRNCCPVDDKIARTFKQYVKGGLAYVKSILQKDEEKFVEQEEAERRANMCLNCVNNLKNYGHSFSQYYTDKMMARSVGNRRVEKWHMLYTCKCCSCILNSKVWFSDKIIGGSLLREDIEKMKETKDYQGRKFKCWQLEARDKYGK